MIYQGASVLGEILVSDQTAEHFKTDIRRDKIRCQTKKSLIAKLDSFRSLKHANCPCQSSLVGTVVGWNALEG